MIGLGTMGAGIAEVFARNGYDVIGVEVNDTGLERGRQHLEHSTGRAVKREKMTAEQQAELLGRITFTTSMAELAKADLIVEAVVESLELKKSIFRTLDDIARPDAVLATNTSSLSVTEISTAYSLPGRVIGVHFFNPAPVQNLVEIIRTVVTEQDVLDSVQGLLREVGKNPVVCGDKAGFIANTLLFGYLNHAVAMYEGKYASREDIDAAMRFGCGYPMGPLALLDLIGLDTAYEILDTMYKQGRDRLHAPAPILKQYVTAGLLGRKSGRGFYSYEAPDSPIVVADAHTPSEDDKPQLRHDIKLVGVVGTGTMAVGHRRGLRQGGLRRALRRTRPGQGRRRRHGHHEELRQADPARPRHRGAEGRGARPGARHDLAGGPQGRRHRRRGDRGGPARSRPRSSRTSTRSASRRRDPGDHDLLAADHLAWPG